MTTNGRRVIGLVANRALRQGPASPLVRLVRELEPYWRDVLQPDIYALEGTYRALLRYGVLQDYPRLYPLPPGRHGGLVALADRVVRGVGEGGEPVDEVVYLTDPRDATAMFPDSIALKRECVVTETTFLATYTAAREWYALDWRATRDATGSAHPSVARHFLAPELLAQVLPESARGLAGETLALIAHDTRKAAMLRFAEEHFEFLARFGARLATGTTGALLNGERPARLAQAGEELAGEVAAFERLGHVPPRLAQAQRSEAEVDERRGRLAERLAGKRWVEPQPSGPKGGDVRIAEAVRQGACGRAIFFEDPHVSREHEADIQLLERTTRIPGQEAVLLHDAGSADRWARAWMRCIGEDGQVPVTLVETFRRLWGVELIAVDLPSPVDEGAPAPASVWRETLDRAAWYLQGRVAQRVEEGGASLARVGVSWGYEAHELTLALERLPARLEALTQDHGDLVHPVTDIAYRRPGKVSVVPLVGIMGTTDPRHEANHSAARLAAHFGGEALSLPHYAFAEAGLSSGDAAGRGFGWDALDAAVLTCDPVRPHLGAGATLPPDLYRQMEGAAAGEVAGIFLNPCGEEVAPRHYHRVGVSREALRRAAQRGASVLLCGPDPERVRPALATLRAGLVSTLITDLTQAWAMLRSHVDERG